MFKKVVKPRTHLMIDLLLFALLLIVVISALIEQHDIHEIAGIAMCLAITVHLLAHLPWIRSQLSRLFKPKHQV
jgi:hypothetical protein